MPPFPEPKSPPSYMGCSPRLGAVDAEGRASELLLRMGIIFLNYVVRVSQKTCRATICKVLNCDTGYLFGEHKEKTYLTCDIREKIGLKESAIAKLTHLKN